jgi:hypothetical protein
MKKVILMGFFAAGLAISGCGIEDATTTKEAKKVNAQQEQYAAGQPVPVFNWSLERDLLNKLYTLRNQKVATHAVWRSDYGMIEGDCPSMGYGLPYDMSLTNPLATTDEDQRGNFGAELAVIEQPEPNGVFASKNTAATWVMCVGAAGIVEPIYIESKVTVYPGPVSVDYANNRVVRSGGATATISVEK